MKLKIEYRWKDFIPKLTETGARIPDEILPPEYVASDGDDIVWPTISGRVYFYETIVYKDDPCPPTNSTNTKKRRLLE